MIRFIRFIFGKRKQEPIPADVVEITSALDKLKAAFHSRAD